MRGRCEEGESGLVLPPGGSRALKSGLGERTDVAQRASKDVRLSL